MTAKIPVRLGKIQETLLLPLWGRAQESKKPDPKLVDSGAVRIIEELDYDFTAIAKNISAISQLAWVARSLHTDNTIIRFLEVHPDASVVNLGCGLDTTFERVDNGRLRFYNLDLPDVIEMRNRFIGHAARNTVITASIMEQRWLDQIDDRNGLLFIAAGVFYYIQMEELQAFFKVLAERFASCDIFFDMASPRGMKVANEKIIEGGGMDETAILKWGLSSAKTFEKWDRRIRVIREFPMFRGFRKGYPFRIRNGLWLTDFLKIMSMVHLRIETLNHYMDKTHLQSR